MKTGKKKIAALILTAVLCCAFTTPFGSAASTGLNVVIDGKSVQFSEDMGVPFVDSNSRTQVPLRVTMEAMGAKVDWDAEVKTAVVSKGSVTVRVPIGAEFVWVNGEKKTNDTAALIKDSRTYLPIRIVAEALGADVAWDGNTKTVKITTHGDPVAWVRSGETENWNDVYSESWDYTLDGRNLIKRAGEYASYQYEYNSRGQLITENSTEQFEGSSIKSKTKYTYNNFGLVSYTETVTEELSPYSEVWYEYNSKGDVTKDLVHYFSGDYWYQTDYTYTYDKMGHIAEVIAHNNWLESGAQTIHTYQYDDLGRLTREVVKDNYTYGEIREFELIRDSSFMYDSNGNLSCKKSYQYLEPSFREPGYDYDLHTINYTYRQV